MTQDLMTCAHQRGGFVDHWWVCARCWARLAERPTRYGPDLRGTKPGSPQVIEWQAEMAFGTHGLSLGEFVQAMAARYQRTWPTMSQHMSIQIAIDCLAMNGDEFGDPKMVWTKESAEDLADEDLAAMESDEPVTVGAGNGGSV